MPVRVSIDAKTSSQHGRNPRLNELPCRPPQEPCQPQPRGSESLAGTSSWDLRVLALSSPAAGLEGAEAIPAEDAKRQARAVVDRQLASPTTPGPRPQDQQLAVVRVAPPSQCSRHPHAREGPRQERR